MIGLAISVLWFLIGVIVLCSIVWLALYVLRMFVPTMPGRFEQAVWVIVMILILIYALTLLAGGGGGIPAFHGR
jgi:hypothetical protein